MKKKFFVLLISLIAISSMASAQSLFVDDLVKEGFNFGVIDGKTEVNFETSYLDKNVTFSKVIQQV